MPALNANDRSRKSAEYTAHLIQLVQAAGETLVKHASEIVGTKSGTCGFVITLTFPQAYDENPCPKISVTQTYVSEEATQVLYDWYSANGGPLTDTLPET